MSPFSIGAGGGGGGGGGGGFRSNPMRTGQAAATSATWYSRSDDCVSYGMFQHETVSLDVHMYRLGHGSLHCAPFFYICSVHVSMHVPCFLIMGPPSSPSTLVWGRDDFSYLVPRLPLLSVWHIPLDHSCIHIFCFSFYPNNNLLLP